MIFFCIDFCFLQQSTWRCFKKSVLFLFLELPRKLKLFTELNFFSAKVLKFCQLRMLNSFIQQRFSPWCRVNVMVTHWTCWYCSDIGMTSTSIPPWYYWHIVNETNDNVNLRYPTDIRILRLDESDFNVALTSSW